MYIYKEESMIPEVEYKAIQKQLDIRLLEIYLLKNQLVEREYMDQFIRHILNTNTGRNDFKFPCQSCGRHISINDLKFHVCVEEDLIIHMYMNGDPEANIYLTEDEERFLKHFPIQEEYIGSKIYRGLFFSSKEDQENFLNSINGNELRLFRFSSWSTKFKTAQNFALFDHLEMISISEDKEELVERAKKHPNKFGVILSTILQKEDVLAQIKDDFGVYSENELILKEGRYNVIIEKIF